MTVVISMSTAILMTFLMLFIFGVLPGLPQSSSFSITIKDDPPYFFSSNTIATPGAPIKLKNQTGFHHALIHDQCVGSSPCVFETGAIAPDAIYTIQSLPPGRYAYHCRLHPIMRGELVVSDPSASTPEVLRIASP